jgi:hypothetical protein
MSIRSKCLKVAGPLAGLALAALAVPAAHGQATRLRVTQADSAIAADQRFLQLAEVQALSGLTNVALSSAGATAGASSSGFDTIPSMANDGNTNGAYGGATGSLWHSGAAAVGEFWEVTFASPTTIDTINLFGRSDCCQDRDNNLTVQLFDAGGTAIFTQTNVNLQPDAGQGVATIAVPEPSVLALGGVVLFGLGLRRRRRA